MTFLVTLAAAFLALVSFSGSANASTATAGLGQNQPPRYALLPVTALLPGTAGPSTSVPRAASAAFVTDVHGPFSAVADECSSCHRLHKGKDKNVLTSTSPQSNLCFTCHDGTGASTNVKSTYTDAAVPQNVVSDRLIYRHDTLVSTSHTSARLNEFGGVNNRHSECSDCHDSHRAIAIDSVVTANGFTNSGRLMGSAGVSVVNGAAGTKPSYTYLPGGTNPITLEYQLCFKCHSSFTTLDSNTGTWALKYSRHRLDKGTEFNPANPSYHPVEAAGKNTTPAMAASLAGPSNFKQYNLSTTSIISCANCHSNYLKYNKTSPPALTAASPLHASKSGGILRQTYRNRVLLAYNEQYDEKDFALCFMCHSTEPFTNSNSTKTNFNQHARHVSMMVDRNGARGTPDIDTIGGGDGNAICAECHFRQHSTTYQISKQTPNGIGDLAKKRLVSFAPSVEDYNGTLKWTMTGVGSGTCELTCHGKGHRPKSYPGSGGGW
jgi:predicted CXXCH cytochrome family protein